MGNFTYEETHHFLKNKAIKAWHLQPFAGNIPTGNGPRPKKKYWYKYLYPPQGMFQRFMMLTLSAFYRHQTPPWAIQEWDIELTVVTAYQTIIIEKKNYIQTYIDPNH